VGLAQLDQPGPGPAGAPLQGGRPQPEVEDRQLLFDVGSEEHDDVGGARLVDGGARQAEHHLGGKPVPDLGVDVVGADHALGQLGPGVGVLVGQPGTPEHGQGLRTVQPTHLFDAGGHRRQRFGPSDRDQLPVPAGQRLGEALRAVDGLVVEATPVAQPRLVDRVGVDAEVAGDAVGG
jgi:hypothetical protein